MYKYNVSLHLKICVASFISINVSYDLHFNFLASYGILVFNLSKYFMNSIIIYFEISQNFSGHLGSSFSWASDSLSQLRPWSHGLWVQAPHQALRWQQGACLEFCLPLSLPLTQLCSLSLSLSLKMNKYTS